MSKEETEESGEARPEYWCVVCSLDLQSAKSLAEHETGRKHVKRRRRLAMEGGGSGSGRGFRRRRVTSSRSALPPLDEEELFAGLASHRWKNVVVLTGAGVSTSAGVPDFRSPGGLYDTIRQRFGERFPIAIDEPEYVLSRGFATRHPECADEVRSLIILSPAVEEATECVQPTATHRFCAWLHRQGVLRRVYTQNVDGLHLHPSLRMPRGLVVECHGSMHPDSDRPLVMYGDALPDVFYECCDEDFPLLNRSQNGQTTEVAVDLIIVFGTSLQVAPFCGVANMVPRGCARALVNRRIDECLHNSFSSRTTTYNESGSGGLAAKRTARIGSRKEVPLRSMWLSREGNKRWRQLVVEKDCDDFVADFFLSPMAVENEHSLDV